MGNNRLGATFARIAETMVDRRREGETALEILDAAAEAAEIRGMDMDFDDQNRPDQPLGLLMFEAFAPNGVKDAERYASLEESIDDGDLEPGSAELEAAQTEFDSLYQAVHGSFRKRYRLC